MRNIFYLLFMLPTIAWAQLSLSPSVILPSGGSLNVLGTGASNTLTSANTVKIVNTAAGNVNVNLPSADGKNGQTVTIKKDTAANFNYANVVQDGSDTIDGSASNYRLYTPNESLTLISDGSNWRILHHNADYTNTNENWTDNQSNATTTARQVSRNGSRLCVVGVTQFTSTASGTIEVTIPTEYSPSSSAYPITNSELLGTVRFTDASTATYDGFVQLSGTNTINFGAGVTSSTYLNPAAANASTPFAWNTSDFIDWKACWEVSNWRN